MLIEPTASANVTSSTGQLFGQDGLRGRPLGLEDKLLLTAEEVAALLGLSRSRVYELLYAKAIVSVKIGKSRRIRRTDLEQFVASLEDDE